MSNEEQEAVRKGILDIPTVITKVNDILDMVNPALLALLRGETGVSVDTDISLAGGKLSINIKSNFKLVNTQS